MVVIRTQYSKELPDYSIISFDKACINYIKFDTFTRRNDFYVTWQKENTDYTAIEEIEPDDNA